MSNEQIISEFLKTEYTDAKLIELLDGAESGVLSFYSCCCLRGLPTAKHKIMGTNAAGVTLSQLRSPISHGDPIVCSEAYLEADRAYYRLGEPIATDGLEDDMRRRERVIPLIKAEILRREQERSPSLSESQVTVGV